MYETIISLNLSVGGFFRGERSEFGLSYKSNVKNKEVG